MDFLCVVMELVVVEEKKLVPAVVRAVTVLDELAASPEPLSFTDLVKRLGMPKSSLYGLCTTLLDLHLIRKLENGSFTLGTHVMGWANAFLSQLDLTQEFFAAWDDMRVLPEETITLSILDGEDVVYIACRNGTRPLGFTFRAGMRLPAVYTATGKAMLSTLPVDLMSLTAHKTYGPKGIGALYVRRKPRIRLEAQTHGGGHERGMRSGTLPTHQIVAMGEAFRIAKLEMAAENARFATLRQRLWDGIQDIEQVFLNGDANHRVPGITNISFNYVEGESMIMALKDIAVSSGSACTSASLEPSYVLRSLGRNDELAHSSIRFTIGRFTTVEDVDFTIELVKGKIAKLRDLSPLWEMYKDGIDLNTIQWAAH